MNTSVHEIADNIFKIRTALPGEEPFTFNQFVIRANQPLLFHTGPRKMFPAVSQAVASIVDLEDLQWITFGHFEDDECGSLNEWQVAAPNAKCACLALMAQTSLDGFANKPVEVVGENEAVLDLGNHRVRLFSTPHFPHAWESQMLFEETTGTLFAGDFGAQVGIPPVIAGPDVLADMQQAERIFQSTSVSPFTLKAIKKLQTMPINTMAIMHGSSLTREIDQSLASLFDFYKMLLDENYADV